MFHVEHRPPTETEARRGAEKNVILTPKNADNPNIYPQGRKIRDSQQLKKPHKNIFISDLHHLSTLHSHGANRRKSRFSSSRGRKFPLTRKKSATRRGIFRKSEFLKFLKNYPLPTFKKNFAKWPPQEKRAAREKNHDLHFFQGRGVRTLSTKKNRPRKKSHFPDQKKFTKRGAAATIGKTATRGAAPNNSTAAATSRKTNGRSISASRHTPKSADFSASILRRLYLIPPHIKTPQIGDFRSLRPPQPLTHGSHTSPHRRTQKKGGPPYGRPSSEQIGFASRRKPSAHATISCCRCSSSWRHPPLQTT